MKKIISLLILVCIMLTLFAGTALAEIEDDERGCLHVTCSVHEAKISIVSNNVVIDSKYATKGYCDFYVNSERTPIDKIIADAPLYLPRAIDFSNSPAPGQRTTASISLSKREYNLKQEYGYIEIYTNVLGAKVEVKSKYNVNTFTGYTDGYGKATVLVKGNNIHIDKAVISSKGWVTQTIKARTPKSGNTISYSVYLERTPEPTPTPTGGGGASPTAKPTVYIGLMTPTPTPAASPIGLAGLAAGAAVLYLLLRRN